MGNKEVQHLVDVCLEEWQGQDDGVQDVRHCRERVSEERVAR